jgi:hypothetical protein
VKKMAATTGHGSNESDASKFPPTRHLLGLTLRGLTLSGSLTLVVLGCMHAQPAPTASSADASLPPTTATTPAASTEPTAPAPLPAIEASCAVDSDCVLYMEGRRDDPCCPECTRYKGANKTSLDAFRAACAKGHGMCAGSCAALPMRAACDNGHCAAHEIPPAPRVIPPLDATCAKDSDCVISTDEIVDNAPTTYACCPSCTSHAANKSWQRRFDDACRDTPAPSCPPISCAQPYATGARCVGRVCTQVP